MIILKDNMACQTDRQTDRQWLRDSMLTYTRTGESRIAPIR